MQQILQEHEIFLRFGAFLVILSLMLCWQRVSPRRSSTLGANRVLHNLALATINTLVLRYFLPITAVTAAEISLYQGWGLFNLLGLNFWLCFILSLLILDLLIYGQHLLMHKLPLLWRLHRVHHTDLHIDVTTGIRFHPLEMIVSMLLKFLFIMLLGAPVVAIIIFEVTLNITAMFNHSNIYIPPSIDRKLRYFIVTPDMHLVHHSSIPTETDSNYGFNLPWWDYIFATYKAQPVAGHKNMHIGLKHFKGNKVIDLHWLLLQPFLSTQVTSHKNKDNK